MTVWVKVLFCLSQVIRAVLADVWKVEVESQMEALVKSCVVLPCRFKYPPTQQPSDRINGNWHTENSKEDFIYHSDEKKIKDNFKGRTKLVGSLGQNNCSLEIDEVKNHDNGPYCFRVELQTSDKDKYSFVKNCVPILMKEKADAPELHSEQSVQEGQSAVFKCSVTHTCPTHQPTLTWNHPGKTLVSYKHNDHGKWEVESLLTFTPLKEDDHTDLICTVRYHGIQEEKTTIHRIFVIEQSTLNHILIPTLSALGSAVVIGGLCFLILKKYKKQIAELQSRNDKNGLWNRLSRMSRRFRSDVRSGGDADQDQRRSVWSRFSRRPRSNERSNNLPEDKTFSKPCMPSPKSGKSSIPDFDDDYTNTWDLNVYGNV